MSMSEMDDMFEENQRLKAENKRLEREVERLKASLELSDHYRRDAIFELIGRKDWEVACELVPYNPETES